MSRREKIIIGLTVLAVIYAGYTFLFPSGSPKTIPDLQQNTADLEQFLTGTLQSTQKDALTPIDESILRKATVRLAPDPFVASIRPLQASLEQKRRVAAKLDITVVYSGYVMIGRQQLAIINGVEYSVGEELKEGGYIVSAISPTSLTLRVKGRKQLFTLLLEEEQT